MLQCMGYDTGMDLEGLIGAAAQLEQLVLHDLPSQLPRAGHRLTRHLPPSDFAEIVARAATKDSAKHCIREKLA
jgi:hydroxymethylglutaryl-CoA lyase